MEYNFIEIEKKWRKNWAEQKTFKAIDNDTKPKYYVLDMFPYPSGAGLHVGHPLGYIASDIYARYKRLQGYNVLHPMGYDSFGLPAEQYAIQTGQHPAVTTKMNIEGGVDKSGEKIPGYRNQLDKIGFSFDWDREVRTSDPSYYKWTQWIFKQLYNSYYDKNADKAKSIDDLIAVFEKEGNAKVNATCAATEIFTADEWKNFDEAKKQQTIMNYRLTFLADSWVNWCPALGTVLANDEIKDGVSERGGHPVEQKLMRQWSMRITAYAERLINDLDNVDWTDSIKDQQRNWIGKSVGASLSFEVENSSEKIEVFTTRPDTVFGVSFMVLAPEHALVDAITTPEQKAEVEAYKKQAGLRTERDRQADVKNISGAFTGAYALQPFTGDKIQIWIGDYVLAGYGTGAVMAVPCGDQRDWDFAKHFNIEIKNIFKDIDISEGAYAEKDAVIANSDFLNDLPAKQAIKNAIDEIEKRGLGKGQTNYRLRDAVFSRQRYWGEPFPIYYKNGMPYVLEDNQLPVTLPEVDKYLPTEDGEPPLARAKKEDWNIFQGERMEHNTMPGWAGSSWYFLRYMDPHNDTEFVSKAKADYWGQVDLYIGGSEHATGHLLYSRFWCKFLFDRGYISFNEPFKKMINQGMILGNSAFAFRLLGLPKMNHSADVKIDFDFVPEIFISYDTFELFKTDNSAVRSFFEFYDELIRKHNSCFNNLKKGEDYEYNGKLGFSEIPININYINHSNNSILKSDYISLNKSNPRFKEVVFYPNEDYIVCKREIEKMSKSKYNVQTPDELVEKFGADTLRLYEMFLGPLEQAKPWDTQGINGVHNFLRRFWRLFHNEQNEFVVTDGEPDKAALKTLHKTIKKIQDDLERFSFNTGVSNFMIANNELMEQKCNNRNILREMVILLSSYAPHICEELWEKLGEKGSVSYAPFPKFNPDYLVESAFEYPVSFNGKMRFKLELPLGLSPADIEKEVMAHENTAKYLEGKTPKKVIIVPGKIVNMVV